MGRRLVAAAVAAVALCVLACGGPVSDGGGADRPEAASADQRTRVAVLRLEGRIGIELQAEDVSEAVSRLFDAAGSDDEQGLSKPDVVIVVLRSDGGMLDAVGGLSNVLHLEVKPAAELVVWVERAASAAALVALTSEQIVMAPEAVLGGAVTYRLDARTGEPAAITGEELELVYAIGGKCAQRGGYDPGVAHAMQGAGGRVLVLNSATAVEAGVAVGTASDEAGVLRLLGVSEHRLVGEVATAWLGERTASLRARALEIEEELLRYRSARKLAEGASEEQEAAGYRRQVVSRAAQLVALTADEPGLRGWTGTDEAWLARVRAEMGVPE